MEIVTIVLLLIIIGILTYYFGVKDRNFFDKHGIPYVRPWPFFGNMGGLFFRKELLTDLVQKVYDLHPDAKYMGYFDMRSPVIVIKDLNLIKSIAVKNFEHFTDHRSFMDEDQEPLFAKTLFSLRGEKWKDIRALLSPAFTSSKMKSMFTLMSECAVTFGEYMQNLPEEKKTTELRDAFTRYTNDVIASCAFGIRVDSLNDPNNDFYIYGRDTTTFNFIRSMKLSLMYNLPVLTKFFGMKLFPDKIRNFFEDIVRSTIKTREENNIYRPDMLQLMMDSKGKRGNDLTIEDMTSQAFSFFFGGFDTISTLMAFMAYELAVNPDKQKRLQDEIDKLMQKTNGDLQYENVINMEYMDAVLNETLRMYPIAVFVDRLCTQDFELPPTLPDAKPLTLKRGSSVWFPVYGIHRDPKYYENPDTFNPDRFLENGKTILNSGTFFPFGLGPRMCIGNRFALLEAKVLYCHLLARCDLMPCEKTKIPLRLKHNGISMLPKDGFWFKVQPRNNPSVGNKRTNDCL